MSATAQRDLRCPKCWAEMDDPSIDHGDVEVVVTRRRDGSPNARARHVTCPQPPNPWRDVIGWCHSCETLQMGDEARWVPMRWNNDRPDWACVSCDDEPWDIGVWPNREGYDWRGRTITAAAAAYLASPTGESWRARPECDDCNSKHADPADCDNPRP